ncbi:hypothetical protein P5V15_011867 [Pogonomyrmex californicus]
MGLKSNLFVLIIISIIMHEIVAQQPTCQLPIERGLCRAYITRYGYNSISGQCERFIYTGCQGNANNFKSMALCEEACMMIDRA